MHESMILGISTAGQLYLNKNKNGEPRLAVSVTTFLLYVSKLNQPVLIKPY
jgi:TfoX/Sxy family transcriptional regulator of competence genes